MYLANQHEALIREKCCLRGIFALNVQCQQHSQLMKVSGRKKGTCVFSQLVVKG